MSVWSRTLVYQRTSIGFTCRCAQHTTWPMLLIAHTRAYAAASKHNMPGTSAQSGCAYMLHERVCLSMCTGPNGCGIASTSWHLKLLLQLCCLPGPRVSQGSGRCRCRCGPGSSRQCSTAARQAGTAKQTDRQEVRLVTCHIVNPGSSCTCHCC